MSSFHAGLLVVGRYRIDREIGRGGMATVYLAHDEAHVRDVAIKVLAPELQAAVDVRRFVDEIRTTARLSHPHILAVLDSGELAGVPFYVTPFVRGESLRDRLKREGTLSLDETVRIGAAIAGALAYAHAEGVIHRDVKPGNVLLDRASNPYLCDFGIARALATAGDTLRTTKEYVLGTLPYMSPEQFTGERELDGTADIYSLGCVIFEMLSGAPPFRASSAQALAAAHMVTRPPPLRKIRADVPRALEELVLSTLAKDPSARTSTAGDFQRALDELRTGPSRRLKTARPGGWAHASHRKRRMTLVVGVAVGVAALAWTLAGAYRSVERSAMLADTTRYAVLTLGADDAGPVAARAHVLLEGALRQWEGIAVVEDLSLSAMASRVSRGGSLSLDGARRVAVAAGAGRLVTVQARPAQDSVRVEAVLRDVASMGQPRRRVAFTIGPDVVDGDPRIADAATELLFGAASSGGRPASAGTRAVAAMRAFVAGWEAMTEWNLPEAERHFTVAAEHDPYFDVALLWKAQVRSWQGRLVRDWEADARRAERAATDLTVRERSLAAALVAMADMRYPDACDTYEELRSQDDDDFAAWFGLGECRRRDPLVLPDPTSPTGWSFRGSGHAAATAYRRALENLPATYRAFGAGDLELVQRLLYARRGSLREGQGPPPGSRVFVGYQEWRGDSLAFTAVPLESWLNFERDIRAQSEALTRQRRVLLDVANAWVRAFPSSGSALGTQALARELVGDPSALPTYTEARALADDALVRASLGVSEAILRVRLALPNDLEGLAAAVELGDSILADTPTGSVQVTSRMAELAVLLGRPSLAARLGRAARVGGGFGDVPVEVVREGQALLAFAAVGAPADSIIALEARTERLIEQTVPRAMIATVRQQILQQPAFLAFPHHQLRFLDGLNAALGREAGAITAVRAGALAEAVEMLGDPFADAGWDALLARVNVLVAAGRSGLALAVLQSHFTDLPVADPAEVAGVARLGGLVRAAALRAELETAIGSREEAIRWARATEVLWRTSEPGVAEMLTQLRRISDSPPRQ